MNWLKKIILRFCSTEDLANEIKRRHKFYLVSWIKKKSLGSVIGGLHDGSEKVERDMRAIYSLSMDDLQELAQAIADDLDKNESKGSREIPDYCEL